MKVGDLVRLTERFSPTEGPDRIAVITQMIHKDFLGIVTAMKIFPSGLVRSQVEWFVTSDEIIKGLWWNSSELEVLDSDDINILRGGCNACR